MFFGWINEVEERANEMKSLQSQIRNLIAGFCGKFFLLRCLKGQMFIGKNERLQDLLGWILWKIQCNNCLFGNNSLHGAAFCKKSNGMWTQDVLYGLITHHSLTPFLPNRCSNNLSLTLQCLIQTLKCNWFKALKKLLWISSTLQSDYNLLKCL